MGETMRLSITNVTKRYNKGKKVALDRVTLELTPGVYGLLGPNGAGKSTLMDIITDNLQPDEGEVAFGGIPVSRLGAAYRSMLGYSPQQQGLYEEFTGYRFLWYMAALKGLKRKAAEQRIGELLEIVNLTADASKKIGAYSGGMKQRLLLAQALLNDPQILILDEPTAGLDPKERIRIRNYISSIALNKIVILATHIVSDVEYIADEIILLKQGRIVGQDEYAKILDRVRGKVYELQIAAHELAAVQQTFKVSNVAREGGGLCVRIVSDREPEGWTYRPATPNLEDLYLYTFDEA